jgi:hypothetical protein
MYRSNQNQDIVRMLMRLRTLDHTYPTGLYSMRRVAFLVLISQCIGSWLRVGD